MTGFARVSVEGDGYQLQATLSSVNGKGPQLKIRLPEAYRHLEIPLKKRVLHSISRGSINLNIAVQSENSAPIRINKSRLDSFLQSIRAVTGAEPSQVSIQDISVIPEIFVEDSEVAEAAVEAAIDDMMEKLLGEFDAMRSREGDALAKVLDEQLREIERVVVEIRDRAAHTVEDTMAKTHDRVAALLAGHDQEIKREDMLREVAILADRCDITEELDRLDAHIPAFRAAMEEGRVGKKLDFILQEMNREANTTGSKSVQVEISQRVISLKSCIETMREQSLNIE